MNSEIFDKWQQLDRKMREFIELITPSINNVIEHKIVEPKIIEYYLDILLDFRTEESVELFVRLCSYYETISYENAEFYWNLFYDTLEHDESYNQKNR